MRNFIYLVRVLSVICISMTGAKAMEKAYMDTDCDQTKYLSDDEQLRVRLTDMSSYRSNMHCSYTVVAGVFGTNLMIQFKGLDITYSDHCREDRLILYDGRHAFLPLIGQKSFCGHSTPGTVYNTSSDALTLVFESSSTQHHYSGFDIIITPYSTGVCYSWDLVCDNGRCINKELRCNGNNPCGDYSDCFLSAQAISGIVVGAVAFGGLLLVIVVLAVRRRRRVAYGTPARRTAPAIATISNQTIQGPPSYSQVMAQGYNQAVPQCISPTPPGNTPNPTGSAMSAQQMMSYPPPYAPPPYSENGQAK